MKIVETDNFDGDYPDEKEVAIGIENKNFAQVMADALNAKYSGLMAKRWYKVVDDNYKLQPGFEP